MKSKTVFTFFKFCFLITLILLLISGIGIRPATANPASVYDYYWQDDFNQNNNNALHPLWSWVRQDASHWSLTTNPGYMTITTQGGGIYGTLQNSQKNLLLTRIPNTDFQIETKVTIDPSVDYQHAALLVYQDDDNYVEINRAHSGAEEINFDVEIGGVPTETSVTVNDSDITFCFIIRRTGTLYEGYYSTDTGSGCGANIFVGSRRASLGNLWVGIGAGNTNEITEIPAKFNYFRVDGDFPNYNLSNIDGFNSTTLDPRWSFLFENTDFWSLTARPGYMAIDTGNVWRNVLVQPAPLTDYWIETYVEFLPDWIYQIAYLVLYHDSQNMMKFGRAYCDYCGGNGIYFDRTQGGVFQVVNFGTFVPETGVAYLRLLKERQSYFGFYRGDPVDQWQLIGRHDWSGTVKLDKIGLSSDQNLGIPDGHFNEADFYYFNLYYAYGSMLPMTIK